MGSVYRVLGERLEQKEICLSNGVVRGGKVASFVEKQR